MPGDNKAVVRTVAVIVLLVLAIVALRGHLPGAEPGADAAEQARPGPGSIVPAFVMFAVSIVIIAIGIVTRLRHRSRLPAGGELPPGSRSGRLRLPWRLILIVAAGMVVWMLVVVLLMRWGSGVTVDPGQPDDMQLDDRDSGGPAERGDDEPAAALDDLALPDGSAEDGDLFGYFGAVTLLLFALSIVAAFLARRRVADATPVTAGTGGAPGSPPGPDLATATERGLAEIGDRSRDPREAIIACYLAMERALEKSPDASPQDSDTPAEVLARAVERRVVQATSAAELVDLFREARFSPHVMDEGHREDALRALRVVQRELRGAT